MPIASDVIAWDEPVLDLGTIDRGGSDHGRFSGVLLTGAARMSIVSTTCGCVSVRYMDPDSGIWLDAGSTPWSVEDGVLLDVSIESPEEFHGVRYEELQYRVDGQGGTVHGWLKIKAEVVE